MGSFEKKTLRGLLLLGVLLLPISLRGKHFKNWILVFLLNSYANTFIAPILAKERFLLYPIRFLSNYYKSSIIYDYGLCSLVTIWYCRASFNDHWIKASLKVFLFSFPEAFVERWVEKNTQLIKYNKGWTWFHSFFAISLTKLMIRGILSIITVYDRKIGKQQQSL